MEREERIERQIVLAAPPADVWAALTQASRLSAWFGAEVDADLAAGRRADFRRADGSVRGAVVETVEPPRHLVFRWLPFERRADGTAIRLPNTRVEFLLEEAGKGTRLRIIESGFPHPSGGREPSLLQYRQGWELQGRCEVRRVGART